MSLILNKFTDSLPLIICVVLLVAMVVVYLFRKKKYNEQMDSMQSNLKVGDVIVTYSGIVGKIIDIKTNQNGKFFTIETGEGNHLGYVKVDSRSIYGPIENVKADAKNKAETKPVENTTVTNQVEEKPAEEKPARPAKQNKNKK